MGRLLFLVVFLFAAALSGSAQTPAQVPARPEPIPVRLEPRHHNVFENAWVRVLDVRIPPGDTSLMHKHETPSIFIVLSNTKTGSEVLIEPKKIQLAHESIWYESFASSPRIHRVWNSDTSEFHTIDLELLNKEPKTIDPPLVLDNRSLTLLFDEKYVRGYRIHLGEQQSIHIPGRKARVMIVALARYVTINNKPFQEKGEFLFVEPGQEINLYCGTYAGSELALFELK